MGRRLQALATTLALGAALIAGGCGSGDGPSKVVGSTLTVYSGLPLHGPSAAEGEALQNGMKMALADAGGSANGRRVQAVYLDDTNGQPPTWDQATTADDARRASQDVTAIGYLGDLQSGATRVSLPITNQAEMTQISPASTAVDLTRAAGGLTPDRLQPSGKLTFARVVPADDVQARAAAVWAKQLGAKSVATVSDGSSFGDLTSTAFGDAARQIGLRLVAEEERTSARCRPAGGKRPDTVYIGGPEDTSAAGLEQARGLLEGVACSFPDARLMASDAMLAPGLVHDTGTVAPRLHVTSPFIDPSRLPPAGKKLAADYRKRFGTAPEPAAAYGYESMALLLDAIKRAGDQGDDREGVIAAVLATRDRDSVLGRYSIDEFGDTTLGEITGYTLRGDRPVFAAELQAP
jgi:branched-chain amino acid transport system substrate-binding protein